MLGATSLTRRTEVFLQDMGNRKETKPEFHFLLTEESFNTENIENARNNTTWASYRWLRPFYPFYITAFTWCSVGHHPLVFLFELKTLFFTHWKCKEYIFTPFSELKLILFVCLFCALFPLKDKLVIKNTVQMNQKWIILDYFPVTAHAEEL